MVDGAGRVAGLRAGRRRAGDRAAGRQNHDVRLLVLLRDRRASGAAVATISDRRTMTFFEDVLHNRFLSNSDGYFLLVLASLIEIRQLHRVEQVLDLRLGQDLLLADDLEDPLAALVGLVGQLGRLLVAEHRIERGHDADRRLHVVREHLLVHRDAVDALGAERASTCCRAGCCDSIIARPSTGS